MSALLFLVLMLPRSQEVPAAADFEQLWADVLDDCAGPGSVYRGLKLRPVSPLLPIGKDPQSGLWEFCHTATGTTPRRNEAGKINLREASGIVFVLLPAGTFLMGCQDEDKSLPNFDPMKEITEPSVRQVDVRAFFVSKFEVSKAQWSRMGGKCDPIPEPWFKVPTEIWKSGYSNAPLHPVGGISWKDAFAVLSEYSMTLPTSTQWEYACRAGTNTPWWTGTDPDDARRSIHCLETVRNPSASTLPVHTLGPNAFGLHHICGNVEEICLEPVTLTHPSKPVVDGDLPTCDEATANERRASLLSSSRWMLCRGGSVFSEIHECRSVSWDYGEMFTMSAMAGIRPVINLPEAAQNKSPVDPSPGEGD